MVLSILILQAEGGDFVIKGILDDAAESHGRELLGYPVLGGLDCLREAWKSNKNLACIVGIGNNRIRMRVFQEIREMGIPFVQALHPSSVIDEQAVLGEGVMVGPGVIINVGSWIGDNVILNTGCTVDHDCTVGAHTHLAPGVHLAGGVKVKEGAFLGIGSCCVPNVTVGAFTTIGAGGVVLEEVPDGVTAVGVPVRVVSAT